MENSKRIVFSKGNGGLPKIEIRTEHCDAEIYLQGAHVTKFQRKGEPPLLFLSDKSRFEKGHPIRGGVPIIFPWFGAQEGRNGMHGFARNQGWGLNEIVHGSNDVTLKFTLPNSPAASGFPKFLAEYFVTVGEMLSLELRVTNQSQEKVAFDNCLHTYFTVGDISAVSVGGLKGAEYLDKVDNFARKTESNDTIKFSFETDRVYLNTKSACEIHDAHLCRKIIVEKEGSNSTVVWNPWIEKSKAMADFGDEEYLRMVCVESGNVSENKIFLPPGERSSLKVNLRTNAM
jgi:glucose-6-phosphate 1-epimerase